jgi:hypothetical protein
MKLPKWSDKVRQDEQRDQEYAYQRLASGDNSCPANRFKIEFVPGKKAEPTPKVYFAKTDVKCAHQAEKHRGTQKQ